MRRSVKRISSATAVRVWDAGGRDPTSPPSCRSRRAIWSALAPATPGPDAVEALVVAEALAIDIGQREVRQVQIVDAPHGRVGGVALVFALAEEDQFEAVAVTVRGRVHCRCNTTTRCGNRGARSGRAGTGSDSRAAPAGTWAPRRRAAAAQSSWEAGHTASVACRGGRRLTCGAGSGTLPVPLPPAGRCRVPGPQRESRESRLHQNWWCGCSGRSAC